MSRPGLRKSARPQPLSKKAGTPEMSDYIHKLEKRVSELESLQETTTIDVQDSLSRVTALETRMATAEKLSNETARLLAKLSTKYDVTAELCLQNAGAVNTLDTDLKQVEDSILSSRLIAIEMQGRIDKFDEEDRKKTLVMIGVPEQNKENLRRYVDVLFRDLDLPYGNEKVDQVFRLGKFDENQQRPRNLIVKLANRGIKAEIYRNIQGLQDKPHWHGVSLQDQLSPQETKEYNELRAIFFLAKKHKIENVRLRQRSIIIGTKTYAHKDIPVLPKGLTLRAATTYKTVDGIAFKSEHNPLSNLFPCQITHNGREYSSVEHAFQHDKALSSGHQKADEIMITTNPYDLMKMGKDVTPGPDWNKGSTGLLYKLLTQKFQDAFRATALQRTGKWRLYECTFHPVYGVGRHPGNVNTLTIDTVKGGNLLGKLLEKVRDDMFGKPKNSAPAEKKPEQKPDDPPKPDEPVKPDDPPKADDPRNLDDPPAPAAAAETPPARSESIDNESVTTELDSDPDTSTEETPPPGQDDSVHSISEEVERWREEQDARQDQESSESEKL